MTKRATICVVILLWVASLFSITANAAGVTTYNLDELNMSIDIADDYDVFIRDTSVDDSTYARYGITKKT